MSAAGSGTNSFRKSLSRNNRTSINELQGMKTIELVTGLPGEPSKIKLAPLKPGTVERRPMPPRRATNLVKKQPTDHKAEETMLSTARSITFNQMPLAKREPETPETSADINSSFLLTSFYQTQSKNWVKPSDYLNQIKQLGLLTENSDTAELEIKLTDGPSKNLEKMQKLSELMDKWKSMLSKALFYLTSQKSNTDKLSEEVKFWRQLAAKFDSLQYEFNNEKVKKLEQLMESQCRSNSSSLAVLKQFQQLKQQIVDSTGPIKKLQLCLEDRLQPLLQQFQANQNIVSGSQLLKQVILQLNTLEQDHRLIRNRQRLVNRKLNLNLLKLLLAGNLSPQSVLNAALVKQNQQLLDQLMSTMSHLIARLEEADDQQLLKKVEYERSVTHQLQQVMSMADYLEKTSQQGKQHLRMLRTLNAPSFNIFDLNNGDMWQQLMVSQVIMQEEYWRVRRMYPAFQDII